MSLVVERFLDFNPPSLLPYTHALVAPEGTYSGVRDVFREMVSQSLLLLFSGRTSLKTSPPVFLVALVTPSLPSLLLDADRGSHSSLQRSHPHHDKGFPCQCSKSLVEAQVLNCIYLVSIHVMVLQHCCSLQACFLGYEVAMRALNWLLPTW